MKWTTILLTTLLLTLAMAKKTNNCSNLSHIQPKQWYAGNIRIQTYFTSCNLLTIKNDLYKCTSTKPLKECQHDADCPKGQVCGAARFPQTCVICDYSKPMSTYYENETITANMDQKMEQSGNPWTVQEFYNHTGVDLVNTYKSWAWNMKGTILRYSYTIVKRSTWGDDFDGTYEYMGSIIYDAFNDTHIQGIVSSFNSNMFDNGKYNSDAGKSVEYYPRAK
eukprot:TRINITY_DN11889_c0_g1_i1.p1 TRINITY_DN11889_c0_g1~~TRINITY_DN11889_c0_g1_i1.p1  ORF type:complete len:247 (-),score=23.17 TRINITY_DN11889_c0_g1_i1:33-698(-)